MLHLPVRGTGDGGIVTTAADVAAFRTALFAGRIVPLERVAETTRPRGEVRPERSRYGLANTSDGAWPVARRLRDLLGG